MTDSMTDLMINLMTNPMTGPMSDNMTDPMNDLMNDVGTVSPSCDVFFNIGWFCRTFLFISKTSVL